MVRSRILPALLLLLSAAGAARAERPGLVAAAREQIGVTLHDDPAYVKLAYPQGDVPIERGVCTDVVVRAFRRVGYDLQELVHRDMKGAWSAYPHPAKWNLKRPDTVGASFRPGRNGTGGQASLYNAPFAPTTSTAMKPARTLTFKCAKCAKPVTVYLQKVSACSHIQPYQGICGCGEVKLHATGSADAVKSFLDSNGTNWHHHH